MRPWEAPLMRTGASNALPRNLAPSRAQVGGASHDEEQVGEPVQVGERVLGHGLHAGKLHGLPLGAAADGAAEMERRSSAGSAGEDEVAHRRQLGSEAVDL